METKSMITVPDDVLEEILLRLSVKHLLQFKCVCKHWYALIRDYAFHKKHYHFQYALHVAEHGDIPLLLDHPPSFRQNFITQFYLLSKCQGADVVLKLTPDFDRDVSAAYANDPEICNLAVQCIGVVNGVVGLQWGNVFYSLARIRLALWNPATREFKLIPRWPFVSDYPTSRGPGLGDQILGLGFDFQSADFKILGLIDRDNVCEGQLYSLRSNSWKKIKETPSHYLSIYLSRVEAQLNNVCYWIASNGEREILHLMIVSFNFSTETYKEFELPEGVLCPHDIQHIRSGDRRVSCNCYYERIIGKYKDDLALYVNVKLCQSPHADGKVEIWVVAKFRDDDNEVPLSWQLVLRIGLIHSFNEVWLHRVRISGDLLLSIQQNSQGETEECIYDPSTCIFNNLEIKFCSSFSYVESLFSLYIHA